MAISANYPVPVYVNGYACNNCAQVAEAKQGINPADPQAGPYGVDSNSAAAQIGGASGASGAQTLAVIFGGVLANRSSAGASATGQSPSPGAPQTPGPVIQPSGSAGLLNISV